MSGSFSDSFLGKLRKKVGHDLVQVPAARIVLEDAEGRILLQHRRDFRKWGLPGGHPEEGESISECIRREVIEETGLRVSEVTPFGYSSTAPLELTTYPNEDRIHSFTLLFHSRQWTGSLVSSNEETLAARFFSNEELLEILPEMLNNERTSLLSYLHFKKSNLFQLDPLEIFEGAN